MIHDAEAEAARDQFINAVVWHSGGVPLAFAPLDAATKAKGQDALARLFLERVKRAELIALEDGSLTLKDLGLEQEANATVTAAIGAPLVVAGPARGGQLKQLGHDR